MYADKYKSDAMLSNALQIARYMRPTNVPVTEMPNVAVIAWWASLPLNCDDVAKPEAWCGACVERRIYLTKVTICIRNLRADWNRRPRELTPEEAATAMEEVETWR